MNLNYICFIIAFCLYSKLQIIVVRCLLLQKTRTAKQILITAYKPYRLADFYIDI